MAEFESLMGGGAENASVTVNGKEIDIPGTIKDGENKDVGEVPVTNVTIDGQDYTIRPGDTVEIDVSYGGYKKVAKDYGTGFYYISDEHDGTATLSDQTSLTRDDFNEGDRLKVVASAGRYTDANISWGSEDISSGGVVEKYFNINGLPVRDLYLSGGGGSVTIQKKIPKGIRDVTIR